MRKKGFHSIHNHKPNTPAVLDEKRLSIEYCRKKLLRKGLNFTDNQVELIREFLYLLAEIEY